MSALVPSNYFSSQIFLDLFKRKKNRDNDKEFLGQQPFIPSILPTLSLHQTTLFPTSGYATHDYHQYGRSGIHTTSLIHSNRSDDDQYQNTWPYMNKMHRPYWSHHDSSLPLSPYGQSLPVDSTTKIIYEYENEVRYVPYPVPTGSSVTAGLRSTGHLEYGPPQGLEYAGWPNAMVSSFGNVSNLPPKIRVIFVPPGSSNFQQSYGNPLALPPFLFNRISQPLCSFPLPPPLPQIGSLPLTPAIQQMVMQQYSNPVAVLPYPSNWQMPQSIMPTYPPVPQQQSIMPMSAWNPYQYASQPYIPPTLLPANMPMLPPNAPPPLPYFDQTSLIPQYSTNTYPDMCRACVPTPPSLNIPVTGYCWVQHCSACHHIPADTINPNVRPNNERSTPLLRRPTVVQNVQNQRTKEEKYPHINASATERPWLHKLPPLPPGAVIISDEYITKNKNLTEAHHHSQNNATEQPRVKNSLSRSVTLRTDSTDKNKKNKVKSRRKRHKNKKPLLKDKSTSTTSIAHTSTRSKSCSCTTSEYSVTRSSTVTKDSKSDMDPDNNQQPLTRQQLFTLMRNIELRYNHQIPDVQIVYHHNNYLKTSDEDSVSLSNSIASSTHLPTINEYDQNSVSPSISLKEEEEDNKSIHTLCSTPFQLEQPKRRLIIIRQFRTNSPSTNSTISSNLSLSIINKDFD